MSCDVMWYVIRYGMRCNVVWGMICDFKWYMIWWFWRDEDDVMWHEMWHGPLARYVELRVAHAPGMPGTFSLPPQVSEPDMYHGTCVTHRPWCMPESLTSGFLWSRWRGKRPWHSRRMRKPQFTYMVSGPWNAILCGVAWRGEAWCGGVPCHVMSCHVRSGHTS